MIRAEYAAQKVAELSVLPRFPFDQDARLMVLRTLTEMVQDEAALDWLVQRAVNLWSKWEGIRELRAIYCSRFHPGDGIETTSALYTDGVPPDPSLPRLALPAPADLNTWPKEELEAIGKAWAERHRLSPAEERRRAMRSWMDAHGENEIALDSCYDDAMIGIAVFADDRKKRYVVYDYEALVEYLEDHEDLSPEMAAEAVANLAAEVLLFYRPPGERMRPSVLTQPVTQDEIDRALTVARARRDGWTPERLAEVEAEVRRRQKHDEPA